jgi:hypothetical protein
MNIADTDILFHIFFSFVSYVGTVVLEMGLQKLSLVIIPLFSAVFFIYILCSLFFSAILFNFFCF